MGQSNKQFRSVVIALGDTVQAALLVLMALILGPLGFLRGPLSFEKWFWYLWMLSPSGLVSQTIRAGIEWRLGSFDAATVYLEGVVAECERLVREKPHLKHRRTVLADFYTLLTRSYLHGGHIDDAMQVIQRAKKILNVDKLPGLPRLDAKTAHLVRAGLAAGKLLEGSGLATLFVKANPTAPAEQKQPPQRIQGATKKPETSAPAPQAPIGKIIPFPIGQPEQK